MFKGNNKDTRTTRLASFWCRFTVSIVNFEHVIAGWVTVRTDAERDVEKQQHEVNVSFKEDRGVEKSRKIGILTGTVGKKCKEVFNEMSITEDRKYRKKFYQVLK